MESSLYVCAFCTEAVVYVSFSFLFQLIRKLKQKNKKQKTKQNKKNKTKSQGLWPSGF